MDEYDGSFSRLFPSAVERLVDDVPPDRPIATSTRLETAGLPGHVGGAWTDGQLRVPRGDRALVDCLRPTAEHSNHLVDACTIRIVRLAADCAVWITDRRPRRGVLDRSGLVAMGVSRRTMAKTLNELRVDMRRLANPSRAKNSAWYFRTGKGEYGYGDRFLGLTVPDQRRLARRYRDLPLVAVLRLLRSPHHEHRLTAVFILVDQFSRGTDADRRRIATAYLAARRYINNWDIVDSSAPDLLGVFLLTRSRFVLSRLVRSTSVWDRRIAVLATSTFIRHGQLDDTLQLARYLLDDDHDLIHKAVGWMLREVGDRDAAVLRRFLRQYAGRMPRTMLRYAIEKFPPLERRRWLIRSRVS